MEYTETVNVIHLIPLQYAVHIKKLGMNTSAVLIILPQYIVDEYNK